MRIVIISALAPPEPLTSSLINWDLANHLAAEGNDIWLISPKPSRPLSVKYPKSSGIQINRISDKFCHIRVDSFTYPKHNFMGRVYESLDFGIKSISYVNRTIRDYDLLYVSSWPFFCHLAIVSLRKNKVVPLIMNIQDLYPESFLIKIKSKALARVLKPLCLIDRLIAKKSTHLTVISESFRQVYLKQRKVPESKISVIQNWQDQEEFVSNGIPGEEILDKYNLKEAKGKFIYMYLGNIGPVAGVEKIVDSFSKLRNGTSYLIIAGSGTARDKCQLLARKLGLKNIAFVDVPPGLKHVAELQSISDVLLLPISPDAASSSIPSKLIAYMLSGKPIITSADIASETGMTVTASGCGWITATNESGEWADVMELACNTPELKRNAMGKCGLEFAVRNFSKTEGLRKISQLISTITQNPNQLCHPAHSSEIQ